MACLISLPIYTQIYLAEEQVPEFVTVKVKGLTDNPDHPTAEESWTFSFHAHRRFATLTVQSRVVQDVM